MRAITKAVLTASLLLGAARSNAESRAGILGGLGIGNLHQTDPSSFFRFDYHPVTRLAVGGVVELGGGGRLAVRLEPMYAAKGSHYLDPSCPCLRPLGYVPEPNDLRLSYLELPVLVVVSAGRGRLRPYLLAGQTVSYLTSARVRRAGRELDVRPSLSKWDLGVDLGGGVRVTVGRAATLLEARYVLGLLSVDDSSSHNRGAQILAGVTYALGHR